MDIIEATMDDFLADALRPAPQIQGRRTGPVQKGEPPARLNGASNQPTFPRPLCRHGPHAWGPGVRGPHADGAIASPSSPGSVPSLLLLMEATSDESQCVGPVYPSPGSPGMVLQA